MAKVDGNASVAHPVWNSLEVCKLVATIATPLIVLVLGFLIWHEQRTITQRSEQDRLQERRLAEVEWRERERLRDLRLKIYQDAGPLLNEIVTYHFYVGSWKEHSPAEIISKKRKLDSLIYSSSALLSARFFDRYWQFMREGFRSAGNHYGESRIRTQAQCRQLSQSEDADRWLAYFTHEDNRLALCVAYQSLLDSVSEELLSSSLKAPSLEQGGKSRRCPPMYEVERCL